MTPLSSFELAGAALLTGLGAMNALMGFATGRSRAGWLFAAFFMSLSLTNLSSLALIGWGEWLSPEQTRWIRAASVSACYLLGPLFRSYVLELALATGRPRTIDWRWHGMPSMAALVVGLLDAAWPGFVQWPVGATLVLIVYHAWVIQGLSYFLDATRSVRVAAGGSRPSSSGEEAGRMTWLRMLTATMLATWLAAGFKRVAVGLLGAEATLANALLFVAVSAALFYLTWYGLRQRILAFHLPASDAAGTRYARSSLDTAALGHIADELIGLMRERCLHADARLDLSMLSRLSGWPPTYISQALNLHLKQNFFEFVSGFRVAAAQRCLSDPTDRRTILEIAMACGFGSKSTFNAVFRRNTGQTPSEYRRRRTVAAPTAADAIGT